MLLRKLLIPLILSLVLALPAYAVKTPGPEAAPGKGKISSPKEKPERVIVIRTAKDPKANQIKVGEKGEILIPQSIAMAGAVIAGAASGAAVPGADKGPAADVALKPADAGEGSKDKEDSNKTEDSNPIKSASSSPSSSGSSDSKSSGSSSNLGGDAGILGGGTPSGFLGGDTGVPFVGNSSTSSGTVVVPVVVPTVPTTALQALLDKSVSDDGVPGAILAVQTVAGTWVGAAGKADVDAKKPMTTDMQVRIGGLTKTITAALTMRLVEEKKLSLTDSVEKWLPFVVVYGNEIKVEMLLNHTSGLHDHETTPEFVDSLFWGPTVPWTNDDVIWIVDTYFPTDFYPGTDYQFCNSGYYILGMVAEAVLNGKVEDAVKSRFFGPLGMSRTALTRSGFKTAPTPRDYCYYGTPDFPELIDASEWDFGWDWTSGSAVSTGQDMLTWTKALFGGTAVNAQSLQQMTSPKAPATDYGFGLEVYPTDPWFGEKTYGHSSESPGVLTRLYYYPNSGRTIFLALNRCDKRFGGDIPMAPPEVDASKVADDIFSGISSILVSAGQ